MPQRWWRTTAALLFAVVAGCTDSAAPLDPPAQPAAVELDTTSLTMSPEESFQVGAIVRDSLGGVIEEALVAWASSDDAVATVAPGGRILAVAPGTASITAAAGSVDAEVTVRVVTSYVALGAAAMASCGITPSAQLFCWGFGSGPGPTLVPGTEEWKSVSLYARNGCAATKAGAGFCWGENNYGQIGNGTLFGQTDAPTAVIGGHTWTSILAGSSVSCGIAQGGAAYCWGRGSLGRLGDGTTTSASTPQAVIGGHTFQKLALATALACGLTTAGEAWCWGAGALGTTVASESSTPLLVEGGHTFVDLAMTFNTGCGLTATGRVWCWGQDSDGVLGPNPQASYAVIPIEMTHLPAFASLFASPTHFCGLTPSGEAWCWGANGSGQLGAITTEMCGNVSCSRAPVAVTGGHRFVALSAADSHTCGLTSGGAAYCWGHGGSGQLGDGRSISSATPVRVLHPVAP
jgi:alpha-tubulin suppressor-like RCC1 family protein